MANLSKIMIESEDAHFTQNPLEYHQIAYTNKVVSCVLMQKKIESFISKFIYFSQDKILDDRYGFQLFRFLLELISEYILHRKQLNERLSKKDILFLTKPLKANSQTKRWLEGAKLALVLESQDPLSDRELDLLSRNSDSQPSSYWAIEKINQFFKTL